MSRRQVTPWLRTPYPATSWDGVELVEVAPAYVPMLLQDLEPRKAKSLWTSPEQWAIGYDAVCKQQEALLMGAREDIIREIRDTRGSIPEGAPTDLETYPVGTYPGIQIADVVGSLNTNGRSAASILASVESILQAQGEGEGGQLEALLQIVALLSV